MNNNGKNLNSKGFGIGQGAILLCAVLWSTSGLFIKLIDWHPVVIAGIRSLIAALFMIFIRFLSPGRRYEPLNLRYLWLGGIIYSATMLTFCIANKLTTAANAILIQYSAPVWAALFGWICAKEKPRKANIVSLIMVMGGLFLFFKDGLDGGSFTGNMLALLSGICFGASSVFLRIQKKGNPADTMLLAHIITAIASIPVMFTHTPSFTIDTTAIMLFMGIIQIGIASLLFSYGIQRVLAVEAILIAAIEPILSPVWVLLIIGEKPGFSAILGGAVIITAVLVSALEFGKQKTGPD